MLTAENLSDDTIDITHPGGSPVDYGLFPRGGQVGVGFGQTAAIAPDSLGPRKTRQWPIRSDPVAGRWVKLPDLPTARGGLAAAVVGGRLVALGGESPTGVFDTVELFDLSANTWSTGPAMGRPRHGLAVATMGSSLYAFGGARQPSHTDSTAAAEVLDL